MTIYKSHLTTADPFVGSAMTPTMNAGFARLGLMFLLVLAVAGAAQELAPAIVVHPGEFVHVHVLFKEQGVSIEGGYGRFNLQTAVRDGQEPFSRMLTADTFKKLTEHEFEITALVGDKIASGEYRLDFIVGSANNLSRTYNQGTDFQVVPMVRIENPNHVEFPNIKDVRISK